MNEYRYKIALLSVALLLVGTLTGCGAPDSERDNEYLIRVGSSVITVLDFNNAFEVAKTAYPHNLMQDPSALRDAQLKVLNELIEELMLLARAEELAIRVSDSEIEKAVADIKNDYPEGIFEQTLLENAISYNSWKKGISTRLLMEKVVAKELVERVEIRPEDISKYYEEQGETSVSAPDSKASPDHGNGSIDSRIIQHLRRKKAEASYREWIENLQKKYTIEINREAWQKITGA